MTSSLVTSGKQLGGKQLGHVTSSSVTLNCQHGKVLDEARYDAGIGQVAVQARGRTSRRLRSGK